MVFKKNHIPWNIIILSDENKNKISELYLDKKSIDKISKEISVGRAIIYKYLRLIGVMRTNSEASIGKKSHLGFRASDESKERMRISHIGQKSWNKDKTGVYDNNTLEKMKISHLGQVGYWLGKDRPEMCGDKNPAWNGGTSYLPYCKKWTEELREEIRERDSRICQNCEKTELDNGQRLSVHHIHYDKENCYPDLIALCRICNLKANGNREYWEKLYMKKLEERNLLNYFGDLK